MALLGLTWAWVVRLQASVVGPTAQSTEFLARAVVPGSVVIAIIVIVVYGPTWSGAVAATTRLCLPGTRRFFTAQTVVAALMGAAGGALLASIIQVAHAGAVDGQESIWGRFLSITVVASGCAVVAMLAIALAVLWRQQAYALIMVVGLFAADRILENVASRLGESCQFPYLSTPFSAATCLVRAPAAADIDMRASIIALLAIPLIAWMLALWRAPQQEIGG
ncbi:hypothetical protein VR010_04945 [Actinomycetaceae bacterium L2_0104]